MRGSRGPVNYSLENTSLKNFLKPNFAIRTSLAEIWKKVQHVGFAQLGSRPTLRAVLIGRASTEKRIRQRMA